MHDFFHSFSFSSNHHFIIIYTNLNGNFFFHLFSILSILCYSFTIIPLTCPSSQSTSTSCTHFIRENQFSLNLIKGYWQMIISSLLPSSYSGNISSMKWWCSYSWSCWYPHHYIKIYQKAYLPKSLPSSNSSLNITSFQLIFILSPNNSK